MNRQKPNYKKQMDEIVAQMRAAGVRKRLLLHACCAPCSSACLELLTLIFDVTVLFYNPNITEDQEYRRRLEEEKRLIGILNERIAANEAFADDAKGILGDTDLRRTKINILEARYDPESFFAIAKGYENAPEGGDRCRRCFTLRLNEAARVAADPARPFDYFTTTLTISPLKKADLLNEIGRAAAARHGVAFLPSDFKKGNGYLRSIQLSEEYNLYRQDYCGCVYSRAERACAKRRAC